jgi:hypothetical protein
VAGRRRSKLWASQQCTSELLCPTLQHLVVTHPYIHPRTSAGAATVASPPLPPYVPSCLLTCTPVCWFSSIASISHLLRSDMLSLCRWLYRAGAATVARPPWRTAPWCAGSRMQAAPRWRSQRPLPTAPPRSSGRTPLLSSCPYIQRPPGMACVRWCPLRAGRRPLHWSGGRMEPMQTASALRRGGSSLATCACALLRRWRRRAGPAGGAGTAGEEETGSRCRDCKHCSQNKHVQQQWLHN